MKKNLNIPIAIIIGSIIIALSIIYYANNDPLAKCMDRVLEYDDAVHPAQAAEVCTGKK